MCNWMNKLKGYNNNNIFQTISMQQQLSVKPSINEWYAMVKLSSACT
jgi:hypothetical protein